MGRLRRRATVVPGPGAWRGGGRGLERRVRRGLLAGPRLAGAGLTGLVVLGALAPAGGEALTWSIVPSPNRAGADYLHAVSCTAAAACTAVGAYETSYPHSRTLIESWDGTGWSVVPSPDASVNSYLDGVSCVAAGACMAVGSSNSGGADQDPDRVLGRHPLVGGAQPRPGAGRTALAGCPASRRPPARPWALIPHAATAAPRRSSNPGTAPAGRWCPAPVAGTGGGSVLSGVACTSATACTAVGSSGNLNNDGKTLIESWNGTRWSIVPSPNPGTGGSSLSGVACATAAACTAAGTAA